MNKRIECVGPVGAVCSSLIYCLDRLDACFAELEPSLKDDYQQLMGHEDQDILNWILGRETLVDESLVAITDKIRAHNLSKLR